MNPMNPVLPATWPENLRRLLTLAVEEGEGWTESRVLEVIEELSPLVQDAHRARLLDRLAAQRRSLAILDEDVFVRRLVGDLNRRTLERWLELEELRQSAGVEPPNQRDERLALEPHVARFAPPEIALLRARAPDSKTGVDGEDRVDAGAEAARASDLTNIGVDPNDPFGVLGDVKPNAPGADADPPPPASGGDVDPITEPTLTTTPPPGEGFPASWSDVLLTATDLRRVDVTVRGVAWSSMTPPRDGRGSERLPVVWQTLLLFLRSEGAVGWQPDHVESGVVMRLDQGAWRPLGGKKIASNALEVRVGGLRRALTQAFRLAQDPLPSGRKREKAAPPKRGKGEPRKVYQAAFGCKWAMMAEHFYPEITP